MQDSRSLRLNADMSASSSVTTQIVARIDTIQAELSKNKAFVQKFQTAAEQFRVVINNEYCEALAASMANSLDAFTTKMR